MKKLTLLGIGVVACGLGQVAEAQFFGEYEGQYVGPNPGEYYYIKKSSSAIAYRYRVGQMQVNFDFGTADVPAPSTVLGYCVDFFDRISIYDVGLATFIPLDPVEPWCTIGSLISSNDPTFDPIDPNLAAAAVQVAIWKTLHPGLEAANVAANGGSELEDRAKALLESAVGDCPPTCEYLETVRLVSGGVPGDPGLNLNEASVADFVYNGTDVTFTFELSDGVAPVAHQAVSVSVSGGGLPSPTDVVAMTGADGKFDITVLQPVPETTLIVDLEIAGRTLWAIDWYKKSDWINSGVKNYLQPIVFPEVCTWKRWIEWSVPTNPPGEDPYPLGNPRTIGFWKHQFATALGESRGRNHVDEATLSACLVEINSSGGLYGELVPDLVAGYSLLWLTERRATMEERAKQQLLASLLNVCTGEAKLTTVIDLTVEGVTYSTVGDLLLAANIAYGDGDFELAKTLCDEFNNL